MKTIPLRNIHDEIVAEALVDDEDHERFKHLRFHLNAYTGYAQQSVKINGHKTIRYLHRLVMDQPSHREGHKGLGRDQLVVDHINGDRLDCRRSNLEAVSHGENMRRARHRKVRASCSV